MRWRLFDFQSTSESGRFRKPSLRRSLMTAPDADLIREAMLKMVSPSDAELCKRLTRAQDIRALWFMRSDVFSVIALERGEAVARQKIDHISAMFRGYKRHEMDTHSTKG